MVFRQYLIHMYVGSSVVQVVLVRGGEFSNRLHTYLVVLAVIVCSWDASCVHCVKVLVRMAGSSRRVGGVDG